MSKKSTKSRNQLLILFLVLLVAVVIVLVNKNRKGERSFKSELMEFVADDVTSFAIYSQQTGTDTILVRKDADKWTLMANNKTYAADNDLVNNMLNELSGLTALQKVAATKDKWEEYAVSDSTGVRVVVNGDKKPRGDIYIGRFSYNQNTRKPKTYVRLNKEKDVYAVDGYLSMTFSRGLEALRDRSVFRGNRNDLTRIAFSYPADSSFTLVKDSLGWNINGQPADSTQISNFLGSVSYLAGSQFRDDLDPLSFSSAPMSVVIEGNNMPSVEIKAIKDESGRTAVLSNANPQTVFDGDNGNLFGKLFVGPERFR